MAENELRHVVQLVHAMYSPQTRASQLPQLEHELQRIQQSPVAWSLISPLLSDMTLGFQVRFFAASTLQSKLARQWDTLPVEQHAQLQASLLDWLSASAHASFPLATTQRPPLEGERVVLRKLAGAVTSLSLRRQDDWHHWLIHVMTRVSTPKERSQEAVLQVLSVVVEQIARAELVGSKRQTYLSNLSSATPMIVSTLASSLTDSASSAAVHCSALHCFTSFLLSSQFTHVEITTLYPLILPHLLSPEPDTCVAACAAVEELVERSSGLSSSASVGVARFINRPKTEQLVVEWAGSGFVRDKLANATAAAAAAAAAEQQDDDDHDHDEDYEVESDVLAVMKLICTLAEHFVSFLFSSTAPPQGTTCLTLSSPATLSLFHLVLQISHFPSHSTSVYNAVHELPSGVWLALQEESSDVGLVAGEGEDREGRGEAGREGDWAVVRDVFGALAMGLRARARRPAWRVVKRWPKDKLDAFRVYRSTTVSEVLLYCYYVLRETMLAGLVQLAEQQLRDAQPDSEDSFEDLEATLFSIYAVQEAVSPIDPSLGPDPTSQPLTRLFSPSVLGSLPATAHVTLRSTALRVIGAYATWFTTSAHTTDALLLSTTVIVSALSAEQVLAAPAARALVQLCDANRRELTPHVGSFVAVLAGLQSRQQQAQAQAQAGVAGGQAQGGQHAPVEDGELAKVLESVASVVQALPVQESVDPILALANPIVANLSEAVTGFAELPTEARELCLQQLNYMTACAKGLSDPDGDLADLSFDDAEHENEVDALARARASLLSDPRVVEMRTRLGEAIEGAARVWSNDAEVVQALADYIRHTTSDSSPSLLSLDTFALFTLATTAAAAAAAGASSTSSEHQQPSPVWLSIASSLMARLARNTSDHGASEVEIVRVGRQVEGALGGVLSSLTSLADMEHQPDVVQAFLTFCLTIVRFYPRVFIVLPTHLDAIISFAERGLAMQERFSLKATIELLIACAQQTKMASPSSTVFLSTLIPHAPNLVATILLAIGGTVPRSHLTTLSELLHALVIRMPDHVRPVVKDLLSRPGWPTDKASDESKIKFERAVSSARTGKQCRQAVSDFAMVCRGLDGSAYGAASLAAFE